jgi:hypothetical protein
MPSLFEWEQALTFPQRVTVESSDKLVDQVQQRRANLDEKLIAANKPVPARKANLQTVTAFTPQLEIQVAPVVLLHRLGVVTTPAVENLVDICSSWAYLRYLWAFEVPPGRERVPRLRLSDAARSIDFHQKGLLSDQIGVGMAALILGSYFNAPLAADVSVAMEDDNWPIELQSDSSPDYLFFDASQANLYVVECKGTQKTRSVSVDQLRRGTEQIPSLTFNDGREPPSIVVATCLSKSGTKVLIIDPPGDESESVDLPEKARRIGEREWRPRSDKQFAIATRQLSEAKVLAFAGDTEAASIKRERANVRPAKTPASRGRELSTTDTEFGVFRGFRQTVGIRDRVYVDVFQGLDLSVRDAFLSDDADRTSYALHQFQERTGPDSSNARVGNSLTVVQNGGFSVQSAGPDGTLFEIRVTSR